MKTILVTGANGYIASLVRAYQKITSTGSA